MYYQYSTLYVRLVGLSHNAGQWLEFSLLVAAIWFCGWCLCDTELSPFNTISALASVPYRNSSSSSSSPQLLIMQTTRITNEAHHSTSPHITALSSRCTDFSAMSPSSYKLTANKSVAHHLIKDSKLRTCIQCWRYGKVVSKHHERKVASDVASDVAVTSVMARPIPDVCTTRADLKVFCIVEICRYRLMLLWRG